MNFEKAYTEMVAGKMIRRKNWEPLQHMRIVDEKVITYRTETSQYVSGAQVLTSSGWRIFGDDGDSFTFIEGISHLKNKKWITHDQLNGGYIMVDTANLAVCRPVQYDYLPNYQDMCAIDWELIK